MSMSSIFLPPDTFKMYKKNSATLKLISLSYKNIAWKSDRTNKFRNPTTKTTLQAAFSGYARPKNWQKNIWELDSDKSNNGFLNQDFIVWMRVAAFPTFRKLHRLVGDASGLEKGNYQIDVTYSILSN